MISSCKIFSYRPIDKNQLFRNENSIPLPLFDKHPLKHCNEFFNAREKLG